MFRRHPTPGCHGPPSIRRVYAYLPTRSHDPTSSDTGCEQRRLGPRHHTQALHLWTMRAGPITDLGAQSHGAAIQAPRAFVRTELSLTRINMKSGVALRKSLSTLRSSAVALTRGTLLTSCRARGASSVLGIAQRTRLLVDHASWPTRSLSRMGPAIDRQRQRTNYRAGPCSPQHGSCVAPYTRSCPVSGGAGSALGTVEPPLVDHASWLARAVQCEQPAA
jgi:hypothetical protein